MDQFSLDRRTLLKAAGATAAAVALAPRAGGLAQDAAPAGNLIIGKAQEAVGLDPAMATAVSSQQLIYAVYDQLVRFDAENQPQPELAESWENPDDTTFVFTLREGATFHDGKPLTSADVKFSFERIIDPLLAGGIGLLLDQGRGGMQADQPVAERGDHFPPSCVRASARSPGRACDFSRSMPSAPRMYFSYTGSEVP